MLARVVGSFNSVVNPGRYRSVWSIIRRIIYNKSAENLKHWWRETMLGSLNRLLVKLCDPRNSVSSPDVAHLRPHRGVISGRFDYCLGLRKKRGRPDEPREVERHDTPSNRSHNFQSRINQIPDELLAEIFATICHSDSDQFLGDRNRHKRTTPLVLASVCSHWRAVVKDSPHVWCHVSLCVSSPSGRYGGQVALLREWFDRSGVCPLTINLVFQNEDDWTHVIAHELIDMLVQQAFRWRSINVVLPESWYPFLEPIKHKLIQLTTVSTQPLWADCGLSPSKRKRLTLFEQAPLLDHLHLNGYYLTDVILCWSRLTRITLQHVYLDECFYALPLAPNLTWCRIYTILPNDVNRTILDPQRPLVLDKLDKFIVYSASWGDLMRLLLSMSFPLLDSFELSALFDEYFLSQLSTAFKRPMTNNCDIPSLTRLVLSDLDFVFCSASDTERELKTLLKDIPTLEELEIEVSKKADKETSAFCSWWFLDLLGLQENEPEREEGKERGRFEVDLRNSEDEDEESETEDKAKESSPSHLDALVSRLHNTTTPSYILPNLQHFTFSGPVVVRRHADSCSINDDAAVERDHSSPLPPLSHRYSSAIAGKTKELEFPRAFLELLSMRGGFGCDWLDSFQSVTDEKRYGAECQATDIPDMAFAALRDPNSVDVVEIVHREGTGEDGANGIQKIYFLDDEGNVLALPVDFLPEPQSSSTARPTPTPSSSATSTSTTALPSSTNAPSFSDIRFATPLPAKSMPFNLRKTLASFTFKANDYRTPSSTRGPSVNLCGGGGMRRFDDFDFGPRASKEVKGGLKRLTQEGGMKMKVVLGGDIWV